MAGGRDGVTLALLSAPRMSARAILSVLPVLLKKQAKEKAYRIYVTDALKAITENTAKYAGGSYIKARYLDLEDERPEETRTPDEIIGKMKDKIARIGGGGTESI